MHRTDTLPYLTLRQKDPCHPAQSKPAACKVAHEIQKASRQQRESLRPYCLASGMSCVMSAEEVNVKLHASASIPVSCFQ